MRHVDTAAYEQDVERRRILDAGGRGDAEAVAGLLRLSVQGVHGPVVDGLPREVVGHAQRLDRVGEGDHREVAQGEEPEARERCGHSRVMTASIAPAIKWPACRPQSPAAADRCWPGPGPMGRMAGWSKTILWHLPTA